VQIFEEATHWLIKHRAADLNPQEKREFDTWLRESPQHVRAYLEMSAVWEDVPLLEPSWNLPPDQLIARARGEGNIYPLADAARTTAYDPHSQPFSHHPKRSTFFELHLQRSGQGRCLQNSMDPPSPHGEEGERREVAGSGKMRLFAIAATLLIAIAGVTTWYWLNRNIYTTDIGEQRSLVLADGSTVELNSRSSVRVRYTDTQRDVDLLEGQALFQVAHNSTRPFIVHSGTADVRAVGTEFDVYKKRAGTVVTVVEGRVAVLASNLRLQDRLQTPDPSTARVARPATSPPQNGGGNNAVLLAAGEQLTVPAVRPTRAGNSVVTNSPQRANIAGAIAWTHRTLVFESSSLTDVAEEYNRYNTRPLVIKDPEPADIHISGVFSSVDSALLLKFLHTQPELSVEETETEIRISKR
jgi:transmembrane sensor